MTHTIEFRRSRGNFAFQMWVDAAYGDDDLSGLDAFCHALAEQIKRARNYGLGATPDMFPWEAKFAEAVRAKKKPSHRPHRGVFHGTLHYASTALTDYGVPPGVRDRWLADTSGLSVGTVRNIVRGFAKRKANHKPREK